MGGVDVGVDSRGWHRLSIRRLLVEQRFSIPGAVWRFRAGGLAREQHDHEG